VAKPDLGNKRQCQNCGTKFFDLNKSPILCPKCGTQFEAIPLARSPARAAPPPDDEDVPVDTANIELVSIEDAEEGSEKVPVVAGDEVEIEDDPADDTFLAEEEEEDDDVSGLIDGEIEDDEEA
jgi:uncharacterized protein (TIGR02300 family)